MNISSREGSPSVTVASEELVFVVDLKAGAQEGHGSPLRDAALIFPQMGHERRLWCTRNSVGTAPDIRPGCSLR